MASGTITLKQSASSGSYIVAKIVWSADADAAANASKDVTAKLYVRKDSTNTTLTVATKGTWSYKLDIAGNSISGSVSTSVLTDWVLVATHKVSSISHNDDGSKSITISGSVSAPSGTSFAGHTTSGSDTVNLDSIARASTITSASAVTLGNKCSVKWTPASASFRYKLKFVLGNWSYTTTAIHPNKTSPYTYTGYTIPLTAADQLPKAKSGTMTVYLYTYSDSGATTQIGSADSETFTVTVPDSAGTKPAVTMELSPVGSLASAFDGLYIQGKTKVKAAISAEGKYGASISSYSMSVEGSSYDSSAGYTSGFLANYGEITVTGSAKDSRGYTGTATGKITVIPYSKPKILPVTGESEVVAARCDADGNLADSGTYLKIKAKRSYSPVKSGDDQKNFCQVQYRYKAASATSYSAWITVLDGGDLSSDQVETGALLGGTLAVDTSYLVQVRAIDDIGEYSDTTINIPTDKVYAHRTKNALGLGKYVEGENLLDCAWDAHFHGDVLIGEDGMTLREYILSVISEGG